MSNLGLLTFALLVTGLLLYSIGSERTASKTIMDVGEVSAVMCPQVEVNWSPCEDSQLEPQVTK